jgi:hypothetical protein
MKVPQEIIFLQSSSLELLCYPILDFFQQVFSSLNRTTGTIPGLPTHPPHPPDPLDSFALHPTFPLAYAFNFPYTFLSKRKYLSIFCCGSVAALASGGQVLSYDETNCPLSPVTSGSEKVFAVPVQ